MTATKTRRRSAPVIRRLRDDDDNLVTYLTAAEVCETVRIVGSTLSRWAGVGLVRTTDALRGSRHYALLDAVALRATPPTAGEYRSTLEHRRKGAEFRQHEVETTNPAVYHGREWDDYDVQFVIDQYTAGTSLHDIARELGRTYYAVQCRVAMLREDGELPASVFVSVDEWLPQALEMMTPAERLAIRDSRVAA